MGTPRGKKKIEILFPRAMKALAGLCDLLDSTASYASASAPASLLIRARREVCVCGGVCVWVWVWAYVYCELW